MVPTVILACCVLHNLAIKFKQPEPSEDYEEDSSDDDEQEQYLRNENICQPGVIKRQKIVDQHFS